MWNLHILLRVLRTLVSSLYMMWCASNAFFKYEWCGKVEILNPFLVATYENCTLILRTSGKMFYF